MTHRVILRPGDGVCMSALHKDAFGARQGWAAEAFEDLLVLKTTLAIGLERGGDISAMIVTQKVGPDVEVLTLCVAERARRCGLGRHLFDASDELLGLKGARTYFLDVAEDNTPALALYDALGFRVDGRRKGYYKRGNGRRMDAILMSRPVAGPTDGQVSGPLAGQEME